MCTTCYSPGFPSLTIPPVSMTELYIITTAFDCFDRHNLYAHMLHARVRRLSYHTSIENRRAFSFQNTEHQVSL